MDLNIARFSMLIPLSLLLAGDVKLGASMDDIPGVQMISMKLYGAKNYL